MFCELQKFFNLLKERINSEYIKIEILNNGNKNQAIYKYMWHVANGVRLKQIFDTPQASFKNSIGFGTKLIFFSFR